MDRRKLEACDGTIHEEVDMSPMGKILLFVLSIGEQSIEPGQMPALFRNGFEMPKSRNAPQKILTLQIDFALGCASKYNSETSDMMSRRVLHSVPLALTGSIHNLALPKPCNSAFNVYILIPLTRLKQWLLIVILGSHPT